MSWNGSNNGSTTSDKSSVRGGSVRPPTSRTRPLRHGLLAGLLVVALGGAAVWWFFGRDGSRPAPQPQPSTSTSPRAIADHNPAAAPTNRPAAKPRTTKPRKKPYWEQPTTNGLVGCQIEKWKHFHRPPARMTNTYFITRTPEPYEIFPTRAENEIAMFLTLEPGESLVGEPDYNENFREEFLKSCETPIIVNDSDSDYEKQLKRDMIQTKIDLRTRMANGEDICKIMAETRNEMMRLGVLKDQLELETRDIIKTTAQSEADIDDAFSALNKMLEKKGIVPIEINPLTKRNLMRQLKIMGKQTEKETKK